MTNEVAKCLSAGDHGSTFGGGPVAASAALAVLNKFDESDVLSHVQKMSDYLLSELKKLNLEQIVEIRGMGLMIGIELTIEVGSFYQKAHEYGILILTAGPNIIRLLPPLSISKSEIDEFIQAFQKLITDVLQ